jgi:hypothetical protein
LYPRSGWVAGDEAFYADFRAFYVDFDLQILNQGDFDLGRVTR